MLTSFCAMSLEEKKEACTGLIWTVNWKLGMKAAPEKSKVIRNQYCEFTT